MTSVSRSTASSTSLVMAVLQGATAGGLNRDNFGLRLDRHVVAAEPPERAVAPNGAVLPDLANAQADDQRVSNFHFAKGRGHHAASLSLSRHTTRQQQPVRR